MSLAIPLLYVLILLGIVAALAGYLLFLQFQAKGRIERSLEDVQAQQQADAERAVAAETRVEAQENRLLDLRARAEEDLTERAKRITELEQSLKEAAAQRETLFGQLAEARAQERELAKQLELEGKQAQEKLQVLLDARQDMSNQFKALANELLEEKSKRFTELNQVNLGQLLGPLQERIRTFQAKVEEVYVNETRDRSALGEQVRLLTQLNNTLSQDTQNLTLALKGDRKAQGNFGEIILDDVLEKAGLLRDQHYVRQGGVVDGQGTSIPDVVIRLPGERFLVIDSKMTLPDYRAFAEADNDVERAAALKRHLTSIRGHIKGLSEKQYQTLYDLKSLDFVVMFVPLEPAFTVAVTNDSELFQHAWEKNVLLVCPSTLLFVVRTVANLWRQEDLSRNAKDISAQGAKLYEKLVGFVSDLDDVGKRLEQAQQGFGDARRKLREGPGNLIGQAEKLRKLGIKPAKSLPSAWVESSSTDEAIANLSESAAAANDDQPK
ncbi:MAG: recombinase RmuC [Panacagrimonas sp.]|jgi:DNA recombination protein RmuC|nr:DNA recombination protein RmuC [Panacagrimonas sp.]MCC2658563.1 recombinase RmuC [Panacagrimonas sp.]